MLLAHVPEKWKPVFRKRTCANAKKSSASNSIRTGCARRNSDDVAPPLSRLRRSFGIGSADGTAPAAVLGGGRERVSGRQIEILPRLRLAARAAQAQGSDRGGFDRCGSLRRRAA